MTTFLMPTDHIALAQEISCPVQNARDIQQAPALPILRKVQGLRVNTFPLRAVQGKTQCSSVPPTPPLRSGEPGASFDSSFRGIAPTCAIGSCRIVELAA